MNTPSIKNPSRVYIWTSWSIFKNLCPTKNKTSLKNYLTYSDLGLQFLGCFYSSVSELKKLVTTLNVLKNIMIKITRLDLERNPSGIKSRNLLSIKTDLWLIAAVFIDVIITSCLTSSVYMKSFIFIVFSDKTSLCEHLLHNLIKIKQ